MDSIGNVFGYGDVFLESTFFVDRLTFVDVAWLVFRFSRFAWVMCHSSKFYIQQMFTCLYKKYDDGYTNLPQINSNYQDKILKPYIVVEQDLYPKLVSLILTIFT